MNSFKTGEILSAVCKDLNLKHKDVAKLINMTPQNVSRIFKGDNVNTDTIDRLTKALKVNLYKYLANEWDRAAEEDPSFKFEEPQGEYFTHKPITEKVKDKPKISLLIEIDPDQQKEVLKLLKL